MIRHNIYLVFDTWYWLQTGKTFHYSPRLPPIFIFKAKRTTLLEPKTMADMTTPNGTYEVGGSLTFVSAAIADSMRSMCAKSVNKRFLLGTKKTGRDLFS